MGLLARFRTNSTARMLRRHHVLAVPAGVLDHHVQRYVREWSPRATNPRDGEWQVTDSLRLTGPIACDDDLRRELRLPAAAATVYAVTDGPLAHLHRPDETGVDLLYGLCRRLDGWVREAGFAEWLTPSGVRSCPSVHAAGRLPRDELLALVAPELPGARFDDETLADPDPEGVHLLLGETAEIVVTTDGPSTYPLVALQPWFSSWTSWTEYEFFPPDPEDRDPPMDELIRVARVLVTATGGLLLDKDGFPWSPR